MPSRDDTGFACVLVTATTTRTSHASSASTGSATESLPSGRSPRRHSTKPPKTERAAEPEPRRARAESAAGSSARPAARLAASASAAKAEAEDASPAPRGTVLRVTTRARSRPDHVEEAAHPLRLGLGRRRPVDLDPVALAGTKDHARFGAEAVEGEREAARDRQVQGGIALPPVLHQRHVHVGAGGDFLPDHRAVRF